MDVGQIRVVMFQDGETWVGQCLEYDIGAQASTVEELHARLLLVVELDRKESLQKHGVEFKGIEPAPKHFHDMWEKRAGEFTPKNDGPFEMALVA